MGSRVSPQIGAASFLDYIHSEPRDCIDLVKRQRQMYLDPSNKGFSFYRAIHNSLRRAFNSIEGPAEFARAVDNASPSQYLHFAELERGFAKWWRKTRTRPSGVKVSTGVHEIEGLTVTLSNFLGWRYANKTELVLPYLKKKPLTYGSANPLLCLLELEVHHLLPDAKPVIFDVRRGKVLRLHNNVKRKDHYAYVRAEAAKYVTHWHAMAA